jgi:hypothetical protein
MQIIHPTKITNPLFSPMGEISPLKFSMVARTFGLKIFYCSKDVWDEYELTQNPLRWDDRVPTDDGMERIMGARNGSKLYQVT